MKKLNIEIVVQLYSKAIKKVAFHQFEENRPSVVNFEENQKKPEGCF
jgi:hypothetical protein